MFRNDGAGNLVPDQTLIDYNLYPGNYPGTSDPLMSGNYGNEFCDFDRDGDMDLLVAKCRQASNDPYDPRRTNLLFVNDGNNVYTDDAAARGLVNLQQSWTATFGDIDNDGDLDLAVGRDDGTLSSFRRNADGSFTPMNGIGGNSVNPFSGIDVGWLSAPTFTDLDRNGTLDLILGNSDGTLSAFRRNNDGSFTPMNGVGGNSANPFGNIDVGFQSTPCFHDIDLDGDHDLVLGNSAGTLSSFRRNDDGTFTPMDGLNGRPTNPFSSVYAGGSSMPTFTDLDFDGDADLVVGRFDGNGPVSTLRCAWGDARPRIAASR
jgi:hypothetical protein